MWNTTSTSSINPYHKKRRNGTLNPQKKNKTKQKQKTLHQRNSYSRLPAKDYYLKEFIDGWIHSLIHFYYNTGEEI
jgi:hypothetical protein